MTEERGEQMFADFLAVRRNRQRWLTDIELAAAVGAGEHVHLLDEDGQWCLGDCNVPLRTGMRGVEVQEVIFDELPPDWEPPDWKESA